MTIANSEVKREKVSNTVPISVSDKSPKELFEIQDILEDPANHKEYKNYLSNLTEENIYKEAIRIKNNSADTRQVLMNVITNKRALINKEISNGTSKIIQVIESEIRQLEDRPDLRSNIKENFQIELNNLKKFFEENVPYDIKKKLDIEIDTLDYFVGHRPINLSQEEEAERGILKRFAEDRVMYYRFVSQDIQKLLWLVDAEKVLKQENEQETADKR